MIGARGVRRMLPSVVALLVLSDANAAERQVLEKPPTPNQAVARVLFDEKPILEETKKQPSVWVRNEDTGKAVDFESAYEGGLLRIGGLQPGTYGVQCTIDDNPSNPPNHPGDYYSWTMFKIEKGKANLFPIHLSKVLHMTAPEDNNEALGGWEEQGCQPRALFSGTRLRFAWDSLGTDIRYEYTITRIGCPYKFLGMVANGTLNEPHLVVDLPTSPPGELYLLDVSAFREDRRVGILMTWAPGFMAWDYRFRVK